MVKYQSGDIPCVFPEHSSQGTETPIWVLLGGWNKASAYNMQTSGSVEEGKTCFVTQILYSDAVTKVHVVALGFTSCVMIRK